MGLYVKPMEGQELFSLLLFLFGKGKKVTRCFTNVFSDVIFYLLRTAIVLGIETIPAPACLVGLMIWHCCYRTKTFEVCGPRIYQSENKSSPLYMNIFRPTDPLFL